MKKLVVLKLGAGDFLEQGFPVTVQMGRDGENHSLQIITNLPPIPELPDCYDRWHRSYRQVLQPHLNLFSNESPYQSYQLLKDCLNYWLNCELFSKAWEQLQANLNLQDEIRFIIETPQLSGRIEVEDCLQRLPWHEGNLFRQYGNSEVAFSLSNYCDPLINLSINEQSQKPSNLGDDAVKILGIIGDSTNIDTQADWQEIQHLPRAVAIRLEQPKSEEIISRLEEKGGWDILFFTGHSSSQMFGNTATLEINDTESIRIDKLKKSLKAAIKNGLKLAVFNSCNGLGLARVLAELNIPQVMIMRELVPDLVAQDFLKHFLRTFSKGESLYASVRKAREKLKNDWEPNYPGIAALPVIFQNPATIPMTWPQGNPSAKDESEESNQLKAKSSFKSYSLLLAFLIVSTFISPNYTIAPVVIYWSTEMKNKMQKSNDNTEPEREVRTSFYQVPRVARMNISVPVPPLDLAFASPYFQTVNLVEPKTSDGGFLWKFFFSLTLSEGGFFPTIGDKVTGTANLLIAPSNIWSNFTPTQAFSTSIDELYRGNLIDIFLEDIVPHRYILTIPMETKKAKTETNKIVNQSVYTSLLIPQSTEGIFSLDQDIKHEQQKSPPENGEETTSFGNHEKPKPIPEPSSRMGLLLLICLGALEILNIQKNGQLVKLKLNIKLNIN
ncbi:MAG TPA: hypothetical protein DDZ80_22455 [Cyanobacteria bacterium UBA8803]|nr:hypothetical protein [Cyanobacteria bacterium UBA9273]HBL61089.1 hypothetical protein [Cyanobacteria bacterium UBA8803]